MNKMVVCCGNCEYCKTLFKQYCFCVGSEKCSKVVKNDDYCDCFKEKEIKNNEHGRDKENL